MEPACDGDTVAVFGDTHGQLHDVLHALRAVGDPGPTRHFIFNGALLACQVADGDIWHIHMESWGCIEL